MHAYGMLNLFFFMQEAKEGKFYISCCVIILILFLCKSYQQPGVAYSYTNFLTTVVLKIHFNNFIDDCSFLMFQFFQSIKMRKKKSIFFLSKDSIRISKSVCRNNGHERQPKIPDLNMTET